MYAYDMQATIDEIFRQTAQRGWSDAKFARLLRVTPTAVYLWRTCQRSPSIDNLLRMAALFELEPMAMIKYTVIPDDFDHSEL